VENYQLSFQSENQKKDHLSEEGKHLPYEVRAKWDTLWIVDPLDGTKEFIKHYRF